MGRRKDDLPSEDLSKVGAPAKVCNEAGSAEPVPMCRDPIPRFRVF